MIVSVMIVLSLLIYAIASRIIRQNQRRRETEKEQLCWKLLRAISHDLRTPLTSIIGISSVLYEHESIFSEEQKKRLLRENNAEAQRLMDMVENLLALARIESNVQIKKSDELAEEVVSDAIQKLRTRFPEVSITFEVPEKPYTVPMDGQLIAQVLKNLMENAFLYGCKPMGDSGKNRDDGKGTVCVQVADNPNGIEFRVSDEGPGLTGQQIEQLEDGGIFQQKIQKSERGHGLGIGFSVCRSIIKAHGGSIRAENRPEGGATVIFTLPTQMTLGEP